MEIILYANAANTQKDRFEEKIIQVIKQTSDLVGDFDTLFETIKLKLSEHIIVFLISSVEELDFLNANKARLFNSRIILILPDQRDDLISKGLLLYPRYIAHMSRDFKDVSSVLNKMIQYYGSEKKRCGL